MVEFPFYPTCVEYTLRGVTHAEEFGEVPAKTTGRPKLVLNILYGQLLMLRNLGKCQQKQKEDQTNA